MSAASSSCPYLPLPLLLRTTAPKSFILSQPIFSLCTSLYPSIKWSDSTYPGFWSWWNGHAGHALSSTPLFYTPVVSTPRVSRSLVPGLAALTSPGNLLEITFQPHPRPMGSVNDRAFQGRVELCLDFPGIQGPSWAPQFMWKKFNQDSWVAQVLQVRETKRKGEDM